ncbi:hypothetical protein EVAR_58519_1 [Eumeta japonica]|uniref:Uncharacterized protein n=1 Tax=Eumeta variegata TaxID=151549 RepID=A0A4C1YTN4_EUMVA|nr:hypothetical protein EVAR_58519_1 [Eumeta japonica]
MNQSSTWTSSMSLHRYRCGRLIDVHEWMRRRCDLKEVSTVEKGVLQCCGHQERMNECRLTEKIYRANVSHGGVAKCRSRKSCTDQIGGLCAYSRLERTPELRETSVQRSSPGAPPSPRRRQRNMIGFRCRMRKG